MKKLRAALTQGDTNGVGLEVLLRAIEPEGFTEIVTPVVYANKRLFKQTAEALGLQNFKFNIADNPSKIKDGRINLVPVGDDSLEVEYGMATTQSGRAARMALDAACTALEAGDVDFMVTAPINKAAIQSEGFHFPGHTEYLENRFKTEGDYTKAQMILFDGNMRIALLTVHVPVSAIAQSVTKDNIVEAVKRLDHTLRKDFGCDRPRIAVLSLNPHAGDGGLLGAEEETEIIPAVQELTKDNLLAFGPYASDGFFGSGMWGDFDGVLAMYHDQGLAPFKALGATGGVNFTAGLDIVRTSPDHGTAYDIAGQWKADGNSMREAIYKGVDILKARKRFEEITSNPLPVAERPARSDKRGNAPERFLKGDKGKNDAEESTDSDITEAIAE